MKLGIPCVCGQALPSDRAARSIRIAGSSFSTTYRFVFRPTRQRPDSIIDGYIADRFSHFHLFPRISEVLFKAWQGSPLKSSSGTLTKTSPNGPAVTVKRSPSPSVMVLLCALNTSIFGRLGSSRLRFQPRLWSTTEPFRCCAQNAVAFKPD